MKKGDTADSISWRSYKEDTAKVYLVEDDYLNPQKKTQEDPKERRKRLLKQGWMVFMSSLGMWSVGSVIVFPSVVASDLINHNTTIYGDFIELTGPQYDELSSLKAIASLPGSWIIAALMLSLGRRLCMAISGLLMIAGWLGIVFIPGVDGMLIARVISGFGIGGISVSVNTYCVELADPDVRGTMAIVVNVGILAGQVLTMVLGYALRYYVVGLINVALPAAFLVALFWLPESPCVLVLKGRMDKAHTVLRRLRGNYADINAEIQGYIELNKVNEGRSPWRELFSRDVLKNVARVCFLFILMHFTGYYVITANTSRVFEEAGSSVDNNLASIIITSVQLVVGMGASFPIDRLGRRKSLMMSFGLMFVPLAIMAGYVSTFESSVGDNHYDSQPNGWVPLACLVVSQSAVVLGVNPVPYILSNEYFPTSIRSQASSICYTVGTLTGFMVLHFYTPMVEGMTQTGLFAFYSSVCVVGIPYTFFFIKETKGKQVG